MSIRITLAPIKTTMRWHNGWVMYQMVLWYTCMIHLKYHSITEKKDPWREYIF